MASAIVLFAWFPAGSLLSQRSNLHGTEAELNALHAQDAALAQEKKNLSDAGEIGRIAREQYQLVSPGQQAYEVLPPSGATAAGTPYAGDPGSDGPVTPSATPELPPGGVTTTTTTTSRRSAARRREHAAATHPHARRRHRAASCRAWCTPSNSGVEPRRATPGRRRQGAESDAEAVARLLGRDPGGAFTVVVRGDGRPPHGHRQRALPRDGTPMPTRYWLVDPELRVLVGRLEAAGGVREADGAGGRHGARRRPSPLCRRARRADPGWTGPGRARAGEWAAPVRGSSASTRIWPGGWPAGTTSSGTWVADRLGLTRPET